MADKVARLNIARDDEKYQYFIQDQSVWRIPSGQRPSQASPESIAEGGFEVDPDYIYFLDGDGDVARERREAVEKNPRRRRRPASDRDRDKENGTQLGVGDSHGITHGLQIRKEWVDRILTGTKTWEIRGSTTARRGPIALIQSKSGHVVGTCDVVDVVGPLSLAELRSNASRAGFRADELSYQSTYAWVLRNARRLTKPVPFRHPQGAVIWVKLEPAVIQALNDARANG